VNEFNLIIKPDEEDPEAAEVLVDVAVDSRNYRFLLDTGAARSCIEFDSYTSGFDPVGSHNSSGVFAKSSEDLITLPAIELGPISKQDFTLARSSANHPGTKSLIGMDILKDFCFHFFFDQNRVLVDPTHVDDSHYSFQELIFDQRFHPYVEVGFGPAKAQAVWDTGAGITVVDLNFIKQHPTFFEEAGYSQGTDSTGAQVQTPMFVMATTIIGNQPFPPHKVAGVDLAPVNATIEMPMDLILGYRTLSKANWLFDFPNHRWAITMKDEG
jgi:hypothetical protein